MATAGACGLGIVGHMPGKVSGESEGNARCIFNRPSATFLLFTLKGCSAPQRHELFSHRIPGVENISVVGFAGRDVLDAPATEAK